MRGDGTRTAITKSSVPVSPLLAYRRRWIRKRALWRAFRKRRELSLVADRRGQIRPGAILTFTTLRNEAMRLPYFLEHYRRLGVDHFMMVDNGSEDGSDAFLAAQPDVTLWQTHASYRASRFGVHWLNWLKWRYAHGHWVLVADADELLVYPDCETRGLRELTGWLAARGQPAMGAIMLDLYPKGSPDAQSYAPGQDPTEVLGWYDAHGYWVQRQEKLGNLWLQGGPRARMFFEGDPARAPTLNKIPLVHWRRGYAFMNSTHSALPSRLNEVWQAGVSGALLHTKFLPGTAERARIEQVRDEHFQVGTRYADYYESLTHGPDLWAPSSSCYTGVAGLEADGLIQRGDWSSVGRENARKSA